MIYLKGCTLDTHSYVKSKNCGIFFQTIDLANREAGHMGQTIVEVKFAQVSQSLTVKIANILPLN